jgi:hypothetical protein
VLLSERLFKHQKGKVAALMQQPGTPKHFQNQAQEIYPLNEACRTTATCARQSKLVNTSLSTTPSGLQSLRRYLVDNKALYRAIWPASATHPCFKEQ